MITDSQTSGYFFTVMTLENCTQNTCMSKWTQSPQRNCIRKLKKQTKKKLVHKQQNKTNEYSNTQILNAIFSCVTQTKMLSQKGSYKNGHLSECVSWIMGSLTLNAFESQSLILLIRADNSWDLIWQWRAV